MLSSVEQAFVGREEIRAPPKTPAWEANKATGAPQIYPSTILTTPFLPQADGECSFRASLTFSVQ